MSMENGDGQICTGSSAGDVEHLSGKTRNEFKLTNGNNCEIPLVKPPSRPIFTREKQSAIPAPPFGWARLQ